MEPVREPPWAEHEKVYLLAEILKAAPISSQVLYGILRDSHIQPKWNDIALPNGRSVRSCQNAYNSIASSYTTPDYGRPPPQLSAPMLYPGPDISKKRAHQPEPMPIGGRPLQPRPPPHAYSGEFASGPAYAMSPVGEPANKKKRGRPTKAESQARAEAALARGETYPPPRKARASMTTSEPPSFIEARQPGQTPPGTAPSAMAMTPQQTQPERGSESSSGKKRRGKPPALELEKPQRGPHEMGSPLVYGPGLGLQSRSEAYSSFTPISAPLPSATDPRERADVRMEGVEETQPRTTTPHSFKDTVGI